MRSLVRHFGDLGDTTDACGICDFCAPDSVIAQRFREATAAERDAIARALDVLRKADGKSTGRLHAEVFPDGALQRREFEQVLCGMARAGLVHMADASFEKDGRRIDYRTVALTPEGREWDGTGGCGGSGGGAGRSAPAQTRQEEGRRAGRQNPRRQAAGKAGARGGGAARCEACEA